MNFPWSELTQSMPECAFLDYESAADVTPRWFAVNFGNGNDGVGTYFPAYYVRTDKPYLLAAAAMVSQFTPGAGHEFAVVSTEIDGEAGYTISATIYNPPDDEDEDGDKDGDDSWCSTNGAWMICEVTLADEFNGDAPEYESLADAFSADVLALSSRV